MRIPNVARAAINLAGVRWRRAERHWRTAERVIGRLGRQAQRQGERFVRAPELARTRVQQGRAALVRSRKRVERFDERDAVAVAKERVDEMGQRGPGAQRGVAGPDVKLVEKDPDDAAAARLLAHGLDHARFAGVGQLEIVRPQILDGLRHGIGHDDIERDGIVGVRRRG